MLVDIISTFFIAIPKTQVIVVTDDEDNPQMRKQERKTSNKDSIFSGVNSGDKKNHSQAEKSESPIYEFRFKRIAEKYLRTYFIFDVLACVPLLVVSANSFINYGFLTESQQLNQIE